MCGGGGGGGVFRSVIDSMMMNGYLRWPKWLTFHFHTTSQFRILNSEIRILNSEFRNLHYEFGIRNCEVIVMWTRGNR